MFGGFSGMLLNDVLVYRPPSCQAFLAEEGCVKAGPGVRCIWSRGRCFPWEPSMANGSIIPAPFCPLKAGEREDSSFLFFKLLIFPSIFPIPAFSSPVTTQELSCQLFLRISIVTLALTGTNNRLNLSVLSQDVPLFELSTNVIQAELQSVLSYF